MNIDTSPAALRKLARLTWTTTSFSAVIELPQVLLAIAAEKEAQQPVAWRYWNPTDGCWFYSDSALAFEKDSWLAQPLFFTEQPREMVAQVDAQQHTKEWCMNMAKVEADAGHPEMTAVAPAEVQESVEGPNWESFGKPNFGAVSRTQADVPLPELSAEDRQLLHDNPNTDDVVQFLHQYAKAYAKAAVAAERERWLAVVKPVIDAHESEVMVVVYALESFVEAMKKGTI